MPVATSLLGFSHLLGKWTLPSCIKKFTSWCVWINFY